MILKGSTQLLVGVCVAAMVGVAFVDVRAQQGRAGAAGAPAQVPGGAGRGGAPGGGFGGGRGPQNQAPRNADVAAMMVALPVTAPAAPKQARRVLVFAKTGPGGFVHSSIPMTARTIEALGQVAVAGSNQISWNTVVSYSLADITAENLAQYDAIVLDSTTGPFLDDADKTATDARKKALLDFVRGGKGLVAIHAGTDSYHSLGNGGDPLWPDFNKMIDGYFKWHWSYPTQIFLKVEDAANPINAPFTTAGRNGGPRMPANNLSVVDEVYTFDNKSWDRSKAHVLTSIDYAKMPAEVKALEAADTKRTDGDYVLSYIRKEGQGRVFVEVLGHQENIYALRPMLEHIQAGVQYAIGDLAADDTPTAK